jgi:hypothetical protein
VKKVACLNCGFDMHKHGVCPSEGQVCKVCLKMGHFARNCPFGGVNAVNTKDQKVMVRNSSQFRGENNTNEQGPPPATSRYPEVQMVKLATAARCSTSIDGIQGWVPTWTRMASGSAPCSWMAS